jgi:hypothetical protein
MIEAGQANAAQNQAGGAPCVGGATGQGMGGLMANAVSVGSHPKTPHGSTGAALIGIIEGAKKSIAAINMVLTILRIFIFAPTPGAARHFSLVSS